MASQYAVVQYVPDPIADERVNIGVFVLSRGRVWHRFLGDWQRVRQFGGEDIEFLQDFARRAGRMDEASVKKMVGRWANSIQLTKFRASLLRPEELLAEAAGRFLREPRPAVRSIVSETLAMPPLIPGAAQAPA